MPHEASTAHTSPPDPLLTLPSAAGKQVVVALAVGQALLLLAFHEAVAREWPLVESIRFNTVYLTLVLAVPAALYLLLGDPRQRQPWLLAGGLGLALLPLALYVGGQCAPALGVESGAVLWPYGLSVALGWFVSLAFMQAARQGRLFHYPTLFAAGWHHALALVLAGLFIGLFWLLLVLWAALFDVLGITFFETLFEDRRFIYPATGLVGGLGLVIVRNYLGATDALLHVLLSLLKALLPLLSVLTLLFLAALPFTGAAPLWDTGRPTLLMIVLLALMIGFLNGVVRDGRDAPPYPLAVRRLVEAAFVLLPAYAALSAYALSLRIGQHGWTADRVWAALVVGLLGAYALAYAAAVFWRRAEGWMNGVRPANVALAGALLAVLVLTHTPLLDPHRIAVDDQVERLQSGTADAEALTYLRFQSGERGVEALRQLQTDSALARQPRLAARLDTVMNRRQRYGYYAPIENAAPDQLRIAIEVVPDTLAAPATLWAHLADDERATECLRDAEACLLLRADVHGDARLEYLLFREQHSFVQTFVYAAETDSTSWAQIGQYQPLSRGRTEGLLDSLRAARYRTAPSEWRDLIVGDERLRVQ